MIQNFKFSNEIESLMPGVTVEETFHGQVQFPADEEDEYPTILWLFRDGVECRVPPISVSMSDWAKFEAKLIQAARDQQYLESLPKKRGTAQNSDHAIRSLISIVGP